MSNCCFHLKYESSIHNIASSSEKVVLSESGEKYAQVMHSLQVTTIQNNSKQSCRTGDGLFLLDEALLIMDSYIFFRSDNLKVKYFNGGFVSYKHAAFLFTRR